MTSPFMKSKLIGSLIVAWMTGLLSIVVFGAIAAGDQLFRIPFYTMVPVGALLFNAAALTCCFMRRESSGRICTGVVSMGRHAWFWAAQRMPADRSRTPAPSDEPAFAISFIVFKARPAVRTQHNVNSRG